MKITHQEHSQNSNSSDLNNHYQFLEQIAITDPKKQHRFFSRHRLNFQALPSLKKKKKTANFFGNIVLSCYALISVVAVILGINYNVTNHIYQDIANISSAYSNPGYTEPVHRTIKVSNLAAEEKIKNRILHLINHPKLDSHNHLYVDNEEVRTLMKQFYSLSEEDKFLNYNAYNYFSYLLRSPFIDNDIREQLAQHGIMALKESYKTAYLARDYYMEHLPTMKKYIFISPKNVSYFDDNFYREHYRFFDFISQYTTQKKYNNENIQSHTDDFWKMVKD